jgi:hypothetical protein
LVVDVDGYVDTFSARLELGEAGLLVFDVIVNKRIREGLRD